MPKRTDQIIEPINDTLDNVVNSLAQPAPSNPRKISQLPSVSADHPAPIKQIPLDLGIQVEKDINGIEMGVLENGIPYLTQKGLAEICGVQRSVVYDISQDWAKNFDSEIFGKDRNSFIKRYLFQHGYVEPRLYIEVLSDGVSHYSYPDIVCMAVLEYYAFESKSNNQKALDSFRKFAAFGLQKFIYEALDYTPTDKWKYHNDRVSLLKNSTPVGYFSIFREIVGLVVDLINEDVTVNNKTIPDISVGQAWVKYWKEWGLSTDYGDAIKYDHNYPPEYPHSWSNPQPSNAYPDAAIPLFRRWFREEYLTTKFPAYILKKANVLPGGQKEAERIANMYQPKQLPPTGK